SRDKRFSKTATVGCELGNLSMRRPRRWTVRDETDVQSVSESIEEAFNAIAVPYIRRYSNLEEMYTVLSDNERGNSLHPFPGVRCQRAVALAIVLQKEEVAELIARCESYLKQQRNENDLREFEQFVEKIRPGRGF